jgi:uncharacterized protein (DUF488 family)
MAHPFFTIGHSTRPIGDFVGLLRGSAVQAVVDVRTVPRSRTNPQYNRETLPDALAEHGLRYVHIGALGGLRGRKPEIAPATNGFWRVQSFHNYADYALTEPFRTGLAELRALGHERRCAVMCAEAVWWRCHRRIIADYLIAAGEKVFHILGADHVDPAHMTEAARPGGHGALVYPAP